METVIPGIDGYYILQFIQLLLLRLLFLSVFRFDRWQGDSCIQCYFRTNRSNGIVRLCEIDSVACKINLLRFRLNALSLPEDEAKALGVNLPLVRGLVIVAASAVTASVVSMCGVIGWVGLLIPHLGRMAFGNDNRRLLPFSAMAGGLFMLVTDTIARCATASEIPVSILTAVVGAPVFLMLLRKTGGFRA